MIPRRALPIFLLIPFLLAACRKEGPLTAGHVAGCWTFQWVHGDTVFGVGTMPDSVRLDTTVRGRLETELRTVAFAGRAVPSDTLGPGDTLPWYREYHASWWQVSAADSIHILFNENWTYWDTRVRVTGGRLAGTATFRADCEPLPPPVVSVRGKRFPCPASREADPEPTESSVSPLPRSLWERDAR